MHPLCPTPCAARSGQIGRRGRPLGLTGDSQEESCGEHRSGQQDLKRRRQIGGLSCGFFPGSQPLAAVAAFPASLDTATPGGAGVDDADVLAAAVAADEAALVGRRSRKEKATRAHGPVWALSLRLRVDDQPPRRRPAGLSITSSPPPSHQGFARAPKPFEHFPNGSL